jgi:glycosyltransferase involved in cell wall biosynthesis
MNLLSKKLAIITNIPTPYRRDLFVKLANSEKFISKVFFTAQSEDNKNWNYNKFVDYPHVFVSGWAVKRKNGSVTYINISLLNFLSKYRPDVIIVGGASISAVLCLIYKQIYSCKVYIWWAGTSLSEANRSNLLIMFRRWLFNRVDGFLCYSSFCQQYLKSFNIQSDSIAVIGNNTLDVGKYGDEARKYKENHLRKISDKFNIFVVSQLIHRKNILQVLETFSFLSKKYSNIILKIAGTGPGEISLKAYCNKNCLQNIYFLGNVQPQDLKKYYAEADVLLSIAHMDQWPQVVNEAMACGVPVIASTTSGIDSYFLQEGINGYLVNPEDEETLFRRLECLILNPDQTRSMGKEASCIASTYDVHYALRSIENAILN